MPDQPLMQINNLHKTYHLNQIEVNAVRGVNLTIQRGEILAIMGPSGCGKTTLLNCLSGLDDPSQGEVILDGQNLHTLQDDERTAYRASHMGFIFQFNNLLPVLSAEENVELPLLLAGESPNRAREAARSMLARVGLAGREQHRPGELSGGQKQRVAIARALINNPLIVWADEPTGDLDSQTSAEIMALFLELNEKQGQTFVMVTHDRELAEQTKRIVSMRSGQVDEDRLTLSGKSA